MNVGPSPSRASVEAGAGHPVLGEEAVTDLEATPLVGRQVRRGERQRVARQGVAGGVAAEVGVRAAAVVATATAARTQRGRRWPPPERRSRDVVRSHLDV